MRTAPGRTPSTVQTLCRPFRAFRWFPIHKPSLIKLNRPPSLDHAARHALELLEAHAARLVGVEVVEDLEPVAVDDRELVHGRLVDERADAPQLRGALLGRGVVGGPALQQE